MSEATREAEEFAKQPARFLKGEVHIVFDGNGGMSVNAPQDFTTAYGMIMSGLTFLQMQHMEQIRMAAARRPPAIMPGAGVDLSKLPPIGGKH